MYDASTIIVDKLKEIGLPVYTEHNLDASKKAPCITYYQFDNYSYKEGDTLAYSRVVFKIRIWGKDMETLINNGNKIDTKMRSLGFKRTGFVEQWVDNLGYRELKYENYASEDL